MSPATAPCVDATAPAVSRAVRSARNGVAVVFALNGLAVATWFSRVPAAREALGLSAGQLGLLLLAVSAGSLLAMPTAGLVSQRLGAARTVRLSTAVVAVGLTGAGLATGLTHSPIAVALGLFAFGYGSGTCDVAMNVEGATVERRLGRTVMPRFHAAWSLGSVAGAGLGAGAARLDVPVAAHLAAVAVVVLGGTLLGARLFLPPAVAGADAPAQSNAARRRALLAAWREP
ncbi:MFS transporter, partial [Micromonospora globbae]|uniref:MFS transporter n=1 Tax=Micromonospora globbae TaxID=1894969 RepID=UPI00344004D5